MFGNIGCMILKYYVNKERGHNFLKLNRSVQAVPLLVYDNVKQLYKNHKSLTALYNQGSHSMSSCRVVLGKGPLTKKGSRNTIYV